MNSEENSRILIKNPNKIINPVNNCIVLKNKRIDYFDLLRILCSFSVILIHVSCQKWNTPPIKSHEWKIFSFYNGISRFGVPIFFMISGTLFLAKNISFSSIVKKYIKNIIIHLIFWSFFYSLRKKIINNYTYKTMFILFLNSHFHLWYLFRICGLYLITPFLKEFTKNEKFILYLILNFIFGFLFQNILSFFKFYSKEYHDIIKLILNKFAIDYFLTSHIFYYMLGFYLNKKNIRPLFRIIIYILGICGMIFTSEMTYYISFKKNIKMIFLYYPHYINVFFMSISIFIFFKHNFKGLKNKKSLKKFIEKLAGLTFGIYIIHPFVIEELNIRIKLNTLSFDPLYSIPINSLITFIISLLIVYFFKFIPFINQYIF